MKKLELLERLKIEIASGLISKSEFEKRPIIDLFDYSKSDFGKMLDFTKTEFNHAFNVILRDENSARQFMPEKFRSIPNKYLKVIQILTDEEILILAMEMYLNLLVGIEAEYLLFVMEYHEEKAKVLNDQDAHKVLKYVNLKPVEEYRDWFAEAKPGFITHDQIEKYINRAEEIKVNSEATI